MLYIVTTNKYNSFFDNCIKLKAIQILLASPKTVLKVQMYELI